MVCRRKITQNCALLAWLQFAPKIVRYCNVDATLNHRTLNFRRSACCRHITCTLAFRPELTQRKRQLNPCLSKNPPDPVRKYLEMSAKSLRIRCCFELGILSLKRLSLSWSVATTTILWPFLFQIRLNQTSRICSAPCWPNVRTQVSASAPCLESRVPPTFLWAVSALNQPSVIIKLPSGPTLKASCPPCAMKTIVSAPDSPSRLNCRSPCFADAAQTGRALRAMLGL